MNARLADIVDAAVARGLLPPTASIPAAPPRPWPLVLLSALGAWLAAIPLLVAFGMLFGDWLLRDLGGYAFGLLLLAGAVVVLRADQLGNFVEQLAVPALLTGAGIVGIRLFADLPRAGAELLLMLLALAVALLLPRPWLRAILGAVAAVLLALALGAGGEHGWRFGGWRIGFGWYAALALWVAVLPALGPAPAGRARRLAAVESIAGGWVLAVLAGLAAWSGMTLLVGASSAGLADLAEHFFRAAMPPPALVTLSVAAGLLGAGWVLRCWPDFRAPWFVGIALVLALLAGFMPALGGVTLVLALAVTRRRPALAVAAVVAALWIVGAFYYRLHWPLAGKAMLLVATGLVVGLLCRFGVSRQATAAAPFPAFLPSRPDGTSGGVAAAGIGITSFAVLLVANLGIHQKETLIASGRPVYLELVPVDPRSLLQGDYMRLNFRMPVSIERGIGELSGAARPRVVAGVDPRGVAMVRRRDDGGPLAADELRIELTPKDGRWIVVSDAWFFREGDAARWQAARYGEFRVGADGKALLVGMADKDLAPIRP